mgnify:CR=1 FL=1
MVYVLPIAVVVLSVFSMSPFLKYDLTKKLIIIFFSLCFITIASLRFETGTDWLPYFAFFNQSSYQYMLDSGLEPFYKLLAVVVKFLFNNYTVFLFSISTFFLIEIYSIWSIAEKFFRNKYSFLILLLAGYMFCFSNFMGGQRQAIAVALCVVSLKYLLQGKSYIYFPVWICAFLFHNSAILFVINFIIYYLISEKENRFFRVSTAYPILLTTVFFTVVYFFLTRGSSLNPYGSILLAKLLSYQGMSAVDENLNYGMRNLLLISERLVLNFIILLDLDCYRKTKITKFIFSSYTFGTIFYIFFIFTARNVAGRGIEYFRFSDMIVLATLPETLTHITLGGNKEKYAKGSDDYTRSFVKKMFEFLVSSYVIVRFLTIVLYANSKFYLPYRSIFSIS